MCAEWDALISEEKEKVRQEMQLQFADERRQYEDERRAREKIIAELKVQRPKQGG